MKSTLILASWAAISAGAYLELGTPWALITAGAIGLFIAWNS